MIYLYGDSHANACFKGLSLQHVNCYQNSITMHRIGRDKTIIGLSTAHLSPDNEFVFVYGEVDCRCHVARQILIGREMLEVCRELVSEYFDTIIKNVTVYKRIIISAVIPPTRQKEYEAIYGPITHEFPFIGTDAERAKFTNTVNGFIKEYCEKYGFTYFDPFELYKNDDGTLVVAMSDTTVHIKENTIFLTEFCKLFE